METTSSKSAGSARSARPNSTRNDLSYVYGLEVQSKSERFIRSLTQRIPEPLQHVLGTLMFVVLIPLELALVLPLLAVWMFIDRLEVK